MTDLFKELEQHHSESALVVFSEYVRLPLKSRLPAYGAAISSHLDPVLAANTADELSSEQTFRIAFVISLLASTLANNSPINLLQEVVPS